MGGGRGVFLLSDESVFAGQVRSPVVNRGWQGTDCVSETCCIVNLLLGKSLNMRLGAPRAHCELGMELCIMNKNRCQHALVSKH